ncbi:hypothetical protein P7C71_g1490, partial [Lecanoromycetidae sp. Uapishka_2]
MAESFSFGFACDDIGYDSTDEGPTMRDIREEIPVVHDEAQIPGQEPQLHQLEDLISALPSRISYSTTSIKAKREKTVVLPHRDIYDIRAQIMAEDTTPGFSVETSPVIGLSADDIKPNIYEGGFKTWECSEDLAAYVFSMLDASPSDMDVEYYSIEIVSTIIASETIYSPSSMVPFTEVILKALEASETIGSRAKALVAAKKIYFGVGGSIDEFWSVLERLGGRGAVVWESVGPGVGRVILEVGRA